MPYATIAELPDHIRELPEPKQRQFMHVWNSAFERTKDEGRAFAMANAAVAESRETDIDLSFIREDEDIFEREFSAGERERLAKAGKAMPGGGFPIATAKDLQNAVRAIGMAADPEAAKAHIMSRARAMGMTDMLPDNWKESETQLAGVTETAEFTEAADGAVEVTIIKAGWSENGRYYSPAVLQAAIPMFEGAHAYTDHPTRSEERERPNRSILDLAGIFEGVHQAQNGDLKARLRLVGKRGEELRPLITEAVKGGLDIGVSINAAGRIRPGIAEGRKGDIVESISSVVSADIVTRPAAGGRFERLVASDWLADLLKTITFEDWHTHHPEHTAVSRQEEIMTEAITEQITAAVEAAIQPYREQAEAAARRDRARERLEASGIPKGIHADLLERVAALPDAEQEPFLAQQLEMLKKLNLRPVVTGAGQGSGETTPISEQFARSVLGSKVEMVKPNESIWEYRQRIRGQTA